MEDMLLKCKNTNYIEKSYYDKNADHENLHHITGSTYKTVSFD